MGPVWIARRRPATGRIGISASKTRLGQKVAGLNLGDSKVFYRKILVISTPAGLCLFSAINYSSDNFSHKSPDLPLTDEPALNRLKSLGTGQKADMLEKKHIRNSF